MSATIARPLVFRGLAGEVPVQPVRYPDPARTRLLLLQGRTRRAAIDAADTFLRENPTHNRVDYAMYVKGLAYFDRGQTFLERLFRKSVDARPPRATVSWHFRHSVVWSNATRRARTPADAQQRMVFLKNRLASYENAVARFYLERDAYVAALNRAKTAIEVYQGSDSAEESLRIMIECYEGLGMTELANDTRRVLQRNFSSDPVAQN